MLRNAEINLICGDSMEIIPKLEGSFDMFLTDPPYASGGEKLRDRQRRTGKKYARGIAPLPDFDGDACDQRSWRSWTAHWMSLCRNKARPGAILAVFIDWRQLASMSDAIQWAGWTWRGIVTWDKMVSRPQIGRFKQQSEFVLWATNGALPLRPEIGVLPGVYRYAPIQNAKRRHLTEKPVPLMRDLLKICNPGGRVCDPFMGSGSTIEAAILEDLDAVGIECSRYYFDISHARTCALRNE